MLENCTDGVLSATNLRYLEHAIRSSPVLGPVLDRWAEVRLPGGWLAAGAVAQTVWNARLGYSLDHGIRDVDIVYFDAENLAAESEQAEEQRIRSLFADLPVPFDVVNEARVHLWYEARFGYAIAPYRSAEDAIATFPTTATAIGVRPADGRFEISAPFGLTDLCRLVVRPNKTQIDVQIYEAKLSRWRSHWPALDFRPWHEAVSLEV